MLATTDPAEKLALQAELRNNVKAGSIDVNIMTKLDTVNYSKDGKELSPEFSDALAALRGYAKSTLNSAIVFSAGLNRRLYTYVEEFKDFYADATGNIKKKIVLKVSDFRSSLTQGKIFAKKGVWVSEFRVESGLNCGGHLFATEGYLLGPILEEFKTKRKELIQNLHELYSKAVKIKNKPHFSKPHPIRVTVQGGIGTTQEDKFLHDHYEVDSTGWGSPFLLVPETTIVDEKTLDQLVHAGENEIYPSDVSPLGVPFSNLKESASDVEKERRAQEGDPGSFCPKRHLATNTEFTDKHICTASRLYQKLKLKQLAALNLNADIYEQRAKEIIQKACICHELGHSMYLKYKVIKNYIKPFPAVCPGPNLAYFSKIMTLKDMVDHIYGRMNHLNSTYRPHMFIKELQLYVDYFKKEVQKALANPSQKQIEYLLEFRKNLLEGIEYYFKLFTELIEDAKERKEKTLKELTELKEKILLAASLLSDPLSGTYIIPPIKNTSLE